MVAHENLSWKANRALDFIFEKRGSLKCPSFHSDYAAIQCLYVVSYKCMTVFGRFFYFDYCTGQFLHREVTTNGDRIKINGRSLKFERKPMWDFLISNNLCLHAIPSHGYQAEGIIEGSYTDYIVDTLFSTSFKYRQFYLNL